LQPRPVLTAPNQEWALDFASDVTAAGQRFRVLGVIDSFTRQCLVLETATSFPSRRVTRVLERAIAAYGNPCLSTRSCQIPIALRPRDSSSSISSRYASPAPERRLTCSGIAASGKKPVITSLAGF